MNTIGQRIAELRKRNGISQDDLAEKLSVARQTVYRWEAGMMLPKTDKLKALCEMLGTDADYILHGNSKETAEEETALSAEAPKKTYGVLRLIAAIACSVAAVFAVIFAVALGCIFFQPASGIENVTISQFHNAQGIAFFVVAVTAGISLTATLIYLLIRKKFKKN